MKMKKWRFISNQNSTIVGINDAGIETFTANMNRSLVREIIQNSLDAIIPGSTEPVTVEFKQFKMKKDRLPDVMTFTKVIEKCKTSNRSEPDAYKFFDTAAKLLNKELVNVLRISDYNTMGLVGSDTCEKGTSWSRLVKENGSSNKGQGSGGSFGIGKSAAFACSDFRTIFYSSLDKQGLRSNIGVARLVSFEDEMIGGWTTGVGYYSEDDQFTAIHELADLDSNYVREDFGTDIYIMGMHDCNDLKSELIKSVILDFLVSLVKGKLVVIIQDERIDKDTLPQYMSKMNPYDGEEIRDILEYNHLLTSSDPKIVKIGLDPNKYGKKYGFKANECTLYLKEGDGLNRKILITRKAGMRIIEQNRISGSIEFTGVLIIDGTNMNEAFKRMEVPSHDAWEPGRCRGEEAKYRLILNDLKKYLRDEVKTQFGKIMSSSIDAFGANEFFPDSHNNEEEEPCKDKLSTGIKEIKGKTIEPTKAIAKAVDITDVDKDVQGSSGGTKAPDPNPMPSPNPEPNPIPGPEPKPEPNPIPEPKPEPDFIPGPDPGSAPDPTPAPNGKKQEFKEIPVKKRLVCSDSSKGKYNISFVVPSTASKGKLEFRLSGEQNDFELPIIRAQIISNGKTAVDSIVGNTVLLNDLSKGDTLKVEVQVDFDEYCMMEVAYYANKK